MSDYDLPNDFADLRRRAEELVQTANPETLSLEDARRLVHELQVHQIELEIQNEELRIAQRELETSRHKYSDLYEFSPVGLLTLDTQEHILEVNFTLAKMLRIRRSELVKSQFSTFIDPTSQDTYHFFFQGLRTSGESQQCEVTLVQPDLIPFFVRLDGIVLAEEGLPPTFRVAVSNVTAKRQVDLKTLELTLERQRMKVLADFIRGTSHDLRTPISSIMTGLYLIGRSTDKEIQLQKIEIINQQLMQLTEALEQLQQMAVLDSTLSLELQADDLHRILHEVIQQLQPQITEKDIHLMYDFPAQLPRVEVNAVRMNEALRNLIKNAIQFSSSGGTIAFKTYITGDTVNLEITDTGMGIEPSALPHIFEHFFKADEARGTRTGGVGLGLPMAQRILELHHASIEVHSTVQVGTTFWLRLPLRTLADPSGGD